MNKLQELNEIKKMRNQLVDIMNVYSKDLEDLFFDLYNYTPTPSYDIEIPEDKLTKLHTLNFMLKILKRIDNHKMSQEFVNYSRKTGFNRADQYPFSELAYRISYIGRQISLLTYGENTYMKKYLPNTDSDLFEIMAIYLYSRMNTYPNLNDLLFKKRFKYVSENIWDMHAIDELSKGFIKPNYKKANDKLKDEGLDQDFTSLAQINSKYNHINIYDLNSYIVANILLSEYIKDPYSFNKMLEELHKTDNTNYEEVLDNLGINYIKHNDIIKSLRMKKGDTDERTLN